MDANMSVSITEFLMDYRAAKNKDEEALAISKAFEKVHIEQALKMSETKKEVMDEVNPKDLLTRQEFHREMQHYATKEEMSSTINTAKWQVIVVILFTFCFSVLTPILLKHFGT